MLGEIEDSPNTVCRILSLDGGGTKGLYTLGILRELEAVLGGPLCEKFDLIYGTSTGSIIAALLAVGRSVKDVYELYMEHIPQIMRERIPSGKSRALARVGDIVLGEASFDSVKTGLGIVAAKWQLETPMIFKSLPQQAHGRMASFVPGFGCTISDAVQASSSAYPLFKKKWVTTSSGDKIELVDGGFSANNPTIYAITDAVQGYGVTPSQCRVLSLGTGSYPESKLNIIYKTLKRLPTVQLLEKTLAINTASMEQLRKVLFPDVPTVRIDETFAQREMATNLFEHDLQKLNLLRQQGAESFAQYETEITNLLGDFDVNTRITT